MLTFAQFQASRREVSNIGDVIKDECWQQPGLVYMGSLFIAKETAEWINPTPDLGDYLLVLENEDWRTRDLESLERRLYEWALSAGYGD